MPCCPQPAALLTTVILVAFAVVTTTVDLPKFSSNCDKNIQNELAFIITSVRLMPWYCNDMSSFWCENWFEMRQKHQDSCSHIYALWRVMEKGQVILFLKIGNSSTSSKDVMSVILKRIADIHIFTVVFWLHTTLLEKIWSIFRSSSSKTLQIFLINFWLYGLTYCNL